MKSVSIERRLNACHEVANKCNDDLWNLVNSAQWALKKSDKRSSTISRLLDLVGSLNSNCSNLINLFDEEVSGLFIGDCPAELCGRIAENWHSWVEQTAGEIVLSVCNTFDISYDFSDGLYGDLIVITDSPKITDLTKLSKAIICNPLNDEVPLNLIEVDKINVFLKIELTNAFRRLEIHRPKPQKTISPKKLSKARYRSPDCKSCNSDNTHVQSTLKSKRKIHCNACGRNFHVPKK